MTDRDRLVELAERVEAAVEVMCPAEHRDTRDYAEISGSQFRMMTIQPYPIMGLLTVLPEIGAALRVLASTVEAFTALRALATQGASHE